ncbi:GOLPH3/VPS74 family protein [Nonomuraea jiangxiensis]|uniref:Golgi phosphoprotein 3 (GPP34) n=1 Tax=Nonomuraea jiangxiensis TaxID=633440 RepID=A0A1G9A6X0_9ACTN|nr:GPP34 family phosphoprotein [Nonomuraea jiangxiensis]SDK23076.1 Golgi phosphoprotein 3 (GPP34) [Nonomuraea jiangxiensis]
METRTRAERGESLTKAAFLLAFDLRKEKLVNRRELGYLLRAAALAELMLGGNLADESGKVRAVSAPAGSDPLRSAVWEQIANSPPRSWQHWIGKDRTQAYRLVRDELAADRSIRVERHRVLVFRVERITLRRPYVSRRLAERVGRAVRGGRPVGHLGSDVRVLAALASAARLKTIPPARDRHHQKERIATLSEPIETITTALRKAIDAARRAATSGG